MAILNGNARANRLRGGAEHDVITGFGGDDRLFGGDGFDVLYGDDGTLSGSFGSGDDVLDGGAGRDVLVGGAGDDTLLGGAGDDILFGGFAGNVVNTPDIFSYSYGLADDGGDDTLDGGDGFDVAYLTYDRAAGITIDIANPAIRADILADGVRVGTIRGVEALLFDGGEGADRVTGGASGDNLSGDSGDDWLSGGDGGDLLEGGAGNDRLDGGAGYDIASYGQARAGVTIDLRLMGQAQDTRGAGIDTLIGIEQVDGSNFDDRIIGTAGDDWVTAGNAGNDRVSGGGGKDFLSIYRLAVADAASTRSVIDGGAGDDVLTSGASVGSLDRIVLIGGAGNDVAYVRADGRQTVSMGNGEDVIVFGLSTGEANATLGRGVDTIRFEGFYGIPDGVVAPVIGDFAAGNNGDRIDLSQLLLAIGEGYAPGSDPFAGGYARVMTDGSDTLVQIDRDAGGAAAFETVLRLTGVAAGSLTAFNFGGDAPLMPAAELLAF